MVVMKTFPVYDNNILTLTIFRLSLSRTTATNTIPHDTKGTNLYMAELRLLWK